MELTYAREPKFDGNWAQAGTAHMIQALNKWGIAGLAIEAFPKAVYNGARFAYMYGPLSLIRPAAKGAFTTKELTHDDFRQVGKGITGMIMYAAAATLRHTVGGDEWWQIKTGATRPDGTPKYLDIRRYEPFATTVWLVDRLDRVVTGRIGQIKLGEEAAERYLSMRKAGDDAFGIFTEGFNAMGKMFSGGVQESGTKEQMLEQAIGRQLSIVVNPLVNVRDFFGAFQESQALKRDLNEAGFAGPTIDKIPWLRSSGLDLPGGRFDIKPLPLATHPTQAPPIYLKSDPLSKQDWDTAITLLPGINFRAGDNFAGREWKRLGIKTSSFIKRDPDPIINRKQSEIFNKMLNQISAQFERSPSYQKATDKMKAAMWEDMISGPDGIAAFAHEAALGANPKEAASREMKQGIGKFRQEAILEKNPNAFGKPK